MNLDRTIGSLVADARGRIVGKVEIVEVDDRSRVIGLDVEREAIRSFL